MTTLNNLLFFRTKNAFSNRIEINYLAINRYFVGQTLLQGEKV